MQTPCQPAIFSPVAAPRSENFLDRFPKFQRPNWAATVVGEAVRRAAIDPEIVDEVILGNVLSAGLGQAPARQAALGAKLPPSVAAQRSTRSADLAWKRSRSPIGRFDAGDAKLVVAGGMENMSRAPHLLPGTFAKVGNWAIVKRSIRWSTMGCGARLRGQHMGNSAEYIAEKHNVTSRRSGRLCGREPPPCGGSSRSRQVCRRDCAGHHQESPRGNNCRYRRRSPGGDRYRFARKTAAEF